VTDNIIVIIPHPPYSPDLEPCDFALFPKLKMKLKGRRFETVSDIQRESQAVLDSIREDDLHGAFEAWKKRWDCCIRSQEDCFEGDGSQN
jgi:histone-lysine N-methyltransferase SETMAR